MPRSINIKIDAANMETTRELFAAAVAVVTRRNLSGATIWKEEMDRLEDAIHRLADFPLPGPPSSLF